jgi:catechol 2,3-dioxygenase-like lactoylglutathione lyase family enzyme
MNIEHFAFNVADPVAMATWYGQHLGLRVIRHIPHPSQTHFLADENSVILEI